MLNQKARSALFWSGTEALLRQGSQFVVTVILARLLSPTDFGAIVSVSLFMSIATALVDGGFSAALIQRPEISRTDESTVFWFNLSIGVIAAICMAGSAQFIANLYDLPALEPIIWALAVGVPVGSLGAIHSTLLVRRLEFRAIAKVSAISTAVSGLLAVACAMRGYGAWALVVQSLTATALSTCILWLVSDWRPLFVFSTKSARQLLSFGGYMLASALMNIAHGKLYTIFIGKLYGLNDLAYYNRAESTVGMPTGILSSIFSRVAFPVFSAAFANKARLHDGARKAVRHAMFINVPVMLGVAAVGESLIETLFGAKWLPAVPAMQILCFGAILWPLHVINLDVLKAQGHSRLFFRLEVIKLVLSCFAVGAGVIFGIVGFAYGQVALSVVALLLNTYYTKKFIGYGLFSQVLDFLPVTAVSIAMVLVVRWLYQSIQVPHQLQLILLTSAGVLVFSCLCVVFRLSSMHELSAFILGGRRD